MARVTYGAMVTNLRGSVGGTTFQSNKAGRIARNRPGNPLIVTEKQSNFTVGFSSLSKTWIQLSLANKILWNDFADVNTFEDRFGEIKTLTGYQYFQSINYWRLLAGLLALLVPPAFVTPKLITNYTITLIGGGINVTSLTGTADALEFLVLFGTLPVTTVTRSNFNKSRFMLIFDANAVLPLNVTASWNAAHGVIFTDPAFSSLYNISFMLQTVRKSSGVASAGLFKTFAKTGP